MSASRIPVALAIASAILGLTLASIGFVRSRTDGPEIHSLTGVFLGSFEADSAGAAEPPKLQDSEAEAAARSIIGDWMPQTDVTQRAIKASGMPVGAGDLRLEELVFVPAATRVSAEKHAFEYTTPKPANVWIAVFQANDLRMDDWGISDGGLFVSVVFEEDTLKAKSVRIERFNPNLPGPHSGKTGK